MQVFWQCPGCKFAQEDEAVFSFVCRECGDVWDYSQLVRVARQVTDSEGGLSWEAFDNVSGDINKQGVR
jgi:hypothetical protein